MEETFATRPLLGRWIALDVRPTRPLTFLGPAWAALCGALASGRLSLEGHSILTLILCLLLCDTLLGAWRALWLQTDWRAALRRTSASSQVWLDSYYETPRLLPSRVLRRIGRRFRYLRNVVWPIVDSEIIGMAVAGMLALSLAMVLGPVPVVLVSLAMLVFLIEGELGTVRGAELRTLVEITFSWLIAETAFGRFSWLSLVFALLYALVYRALLGLATARQSRWILWSNLAQLAVVLLLIAKNSPVEAAVVLLGLLAQILWQARYHIDRDGGGYARRVQSYVLVGMVLAGLSLWL